jgi:hypothetical protein
MFLCDNCFKADELSKFIMPRSKGPCEGCGEYASCYDVPPGFPTKPKDKPKKEENK